MLLWRWLIVLIVAACAHVAYAYTLSNESLARVLKPSAAQWIHVRSPTSLLSQILIPRVPGTQGHAEVRERLTKPFFDAKDAHGRPKWHVELIPFEAPTPLGLRKFTNIVVTRDPEAARKLVLAAHYDSKYYPEDSPSHGFVGATDSAFPCTLLVDTAMALDAQLDAYTANRTHARTSALPLKDDVSLQIMFLDGEEAFHSWTSEDSLYGARQLSSLWANTWEQPAWDSLRLEQRHAVGRFAPIRRVNTIQHMVLLDLLGAPNTTVPHYFASTRHVHKHFREIEERLLATQQLWPRESVYQRIFSSERGLAGIEDDHLPFLRQGVPVVHLIPWPFPHVWHTRQDDASALDQPTMDAWSRILRVFTAEYLGLT